MDGTIIQNTSSISGPSFGGDDEVITLGSGSFDSFYDILTINGMIKVDVASSGRLHLKARNADASTFYFNEATALYIKRVGDAT